VNRIDARWIALAVFFLLLDLKVISQLTVGSDWAPLWSAGRLAWEAQSRIYDFGLIAKLQHVAVGGVDFHPFIYPPSALLLIAPIASLPFWPSLALVAGGSLIWLAATSRRIGADSVLLLLAPPVFMAAIVGQASLFVIGMVVLACCLLDKQEGAAGALLALAALIKPTLLVMAPLALVAGRHWQALGSATLVGFAGLAATILLFGMETWFDWLHAIPVFQQMFDDYPPLVRNAVTPYALAARLGFASWAIVVACGIIAAILAWKGFARRIDPASRSVLLMGGGLLLTPYAMNYELAALAPAILAMARERLRDFSLVALWAASLFANLSFLGLLIAWLLIASRVIGKVADQPATSTS
jgi:hypothetical protein